MNTVLARPDLIVFTLSEDLLIEKILTAQDRERDQRHGRNDSRKRRDCVVPTQTPRHQAALDVSI